MNTLVIIDMQNDFIDGALSNPDAQKAVCGTARLAAEFEGEIVFTRDTHGENYMNTAEGKSLPIPHCIKGTHGWEINSEIFAAAEGNKKAKIKIVDKSSFGAGTLLYEAIISDGIPESITFTGTCTDICVVSNVLILKSFLTETPMSVIEELCAGLTREKHNAAIEVMKSCQVKVI